MRVCVCVCVCAYVYHSWLGFVKRGSRKSQSTPTASTFVSEKADTELEDTVAATAVKGLEWP